MLLINDKESNTSSTRTKASSSVFITNLAESTSVCSRDVVGEAKTVKTSQSYIGREMRKTILTPKMQIASVFQLMRL